MRPENSAIGRVEPRPLYARCDLLRDGDGLLRMMELELIEPSLYLRMDDEEPRRLAVVFDNYVRQRGVR